MFILSILVTCKIVKDMLVCGGEMADKLLALQVVTAALQAPFEHSYCWAN